MEDILGVSFDEICGDLGMNPRQVRYDGAVIGNPNPIIYDDGLEPLYPSSIDTHVYKDVIHKYRVFIPRSRLSELGDFATATKPNNKLWEISEDSGVTWFPVQTFLEAKRDAVRAEIFLGCLPLSPYGEGFNAVLVFQDPNGSTLSTDAQGNPVIVPSNASTEIKAVLEHRRPGVERYPGIDEQAIFFTGRLVDPLVLPDFITPLMRCPANVSGASGEFIITTADQSPFGSDDTAGARIEGYLSTGR